MSINYYKVCIACIARAVHYHRAEPEKIAANTHFNGERLRLSIASTDYGDQTILIDDTGHITSLQELKDRCYSRAGKTVDPQDRIRPAVPDRSRHSDTW